MNACEDVFMFLHIYMEPRIQPWVPLLRTMSTLFFETLSHIGLELENLISLVDQRVLVILLFLLFISGIIRMSYCTGLFHTGSKDWPWVLIFALEEL